LKPTDISVRWRSFQAVMPGDFETNRRSLKEFRKNRQLSATMRKLTTATTDIMRHLEAKAEDAHERQQVASARAPCGPESQRRENEPSQPNGGFMATIIFDDATTNEAALIAATTNAGYPAHVASTN
jgi:hypothetical protein